MFDILLWQNFRQLLKSSGSISTQGELVDRIGTNPEKSFVKEMLDINAIYDEIVERQKYGDSLKWFLQN